MFRIKNKVAKFSKYSQQKKLEVIQHVLYKLITLILYKCRLKYLGKNSVIKSPLIITPKCLSLGNNVSIGPHARIECICEWNNTKYIPQVVLEDGVSFQQRCHITSAGKLVIGKNTIASFDVMITNIDHEYTDINLPIAQQNLNIKETSIGENCFIGAGVKIQAGTVLGRHCIVGANAVVRGIFPDYCVIVGTPARIIKKYNHKTKEWEKI